MSAKFSYLFIAAIVLICHIAQCQTFTVGTNGLTIMAGTTIIVDSLNMTPSVNVTMASNAITRNSAAVIINGDSSISNGFTFAVPFTYSGVLKLGYNSNRLNGNAASDLVVAYDSSVGSSYTYNCGSVVDTTAKSITNTLSAANVYYITAIKSSVNVAPISGVSTLDVGATTTMTTTTTGGTWSSTDTSLATITSGGVATAIAGGSDTIMYTKTNTCNTAYQYKVVNINASNSWMGVASNDWSVGANWSTGYIPTAAVNAIIPTGTPYEPTISTGCYSAKDLSIAAGVRLTINADDTLMLKGNLANNGSVTGSGLLTMNGSAIQTISGTGNVNKFQLNNSSGASIDSGALMTVKNTLYVSNGILTTHDSLVLASDVAGSARVDSIPATGASITGKVKVNQYMTGGRRAYRFWSHPFTSSIPLSQLTNSIDISGPGGSANGFTTTASNQPSSYWYNTYGGNSSIAYDPGWRQFASAYATPDSNEFKQYQGIRLYYRGAKGEGLGFGAYTPSATVISQWGTLNQGNQDIPMHRGTSALQDYTMVGNPYASPVDIGTVIFNAAAEGKINSAYYYIWNPFLGVAGQFQAMPYSTGGTTPTAIPYYIQANNCFQVRTLHDGDELNFKEANKSSTITSSYSLMKIRQELVSLHVYDTHYHPYDMFFVDFDDAATNNEDAKYDGGKPTGAEVNLYSISADNRKLSVDARPYINDGTIPLGFTSAYAQDYIIKAENITVPNGGILYLHDKLLGKHVLLQEGTTYTFSVTKDPATQGEHRFELAMKPENAAGVHHLTNSMTLIPNPATDVVTIEYQFAKKDKVLIKVTDMTGMCVYNCDKGYKTSGTVELPVINFASGIYFVEITSGNEKIAQKLVKL